eukprot:PhM_4_TR13395/c0_g1_i1/m.7084
MTSLDADEIRRTMAREEHLRRNHSICIPGDELAQHFGAGIEAYFAYCRVLLVTNAVFMFLQIICFSVYVSAEEPGYDRGDYWYNDLFITSFTSDQRSMWLGINSVCVVISALTLPAVLLRRKSYEDSETGDVIMRAAEGAVQQQSSSQDIIIRYTDEGYIDVSSHFRTPLNKALRTVFSACVFCGLLAVQVLVSYYVTQIEDQSANAVVSFLIAVVVGLLNLTYGLVADLLTEFEKPKTMRQFKTSNTLKLLLFKLGNVITVYAAKTYSSVQDCAYDVIGQQFLYILVVDITVMNVLEMLLPRVTSRLRRYMALRNKDDLQSDQDLLPPFDVSYEYLDTIYRQYLVYMAMTVFPLSVVLSWVGQVLEYWLDKYKLLRVAGKPKRMDYSFRSQGIMIMVFQVIAFAAAMLTPYAGVIWVLSGDTSSATAKDCNFP